LDDKGNLVKSGIPETQIIGSAVPFRPFKPRYAESQPEGWSLGSGLDRGHLLARQLGGVGDDRRNLVPLYRDVNRGAMKDYENEVATAIEAGQTVYFQRDGQLRWRQFGTDVSYNDRHDSEWGSDRQRDDTEYSMNWPHSRE
jgi:DNA/RNA non-specific endonuclease